MTDQGPITPHMPSLQLQPIREAIKPLDLRVCAVAVAFSRWRLLTVAMVASCGGDSDDLLAAMAHLQWRPKRNVADLWLIAFL